jgi:hypothetical protein
LKKYKLLKDRFEHKAGIEVYEYSKYDYGCSSLDELITGMRHSVVSAVDYDTKPFFTVPTCDLRIISD